MRQVNTHTLHGGFFTEQHREEGQDEEHEAGKNEENDREVAVLRQSAGYSQPDPLPDVGNSHQDGVHGGGDAGLGVFHGEREVNCLAEPIRQSEEDGGRPHEGFARDEGDEYQRRHHQDQREQQGVAVAGFVHHEPAEESPSHAANSPHGGYQAGGSKVNAEAGRKMRVDVLICAHNDQEDDEADQRGADHLPVFEGSKRRPLEAHFCGPGNFLDEEDERDRDEREDGEEIKHGGPAKMLGNESGGRSGNDDADGTPADHESLQDAALMFRGDIQRQTVGAGVVERHAQLQQERQRNIRPIMLAGVDVGNQQQTYELHDKPDNDIRTAVSQLEEIHPVAEHAKENLDHKGDEGDGRENAHLAHIQPAVQHIERVERGEVSQDGALGEVEQREHRKPQDLVLRGHGEILCVKNWDGFIIQETQNQ